MMAWLILVLLLCLSLLVLRFLGTRGAFLQACAAALLFGAAGYALQGSPGMAGAPAKGSAGRNVLPLTGARHAFFGNFTPEEHWLLLSEGLARSGNTADAVGILQNAVRRYPTDAHLWVGLGNALVDHSGSLTPPAELAYRRAEELLPGHPAAPFFYGLALARSGDRQGAIKQWHQILEAAPADASWRPLVEQGISALSSPRS